MSQCSISWKGLREVTSATIIDASVTQIQMSQCSISWKERAETISAITIDGIVAQIQMSQFNILWNKHKTRNSRNTNVIATQIQMSQCYISISWKNPKERISTRSVNLIGTQIQISQCCIC